MDHNAQLICSSTNNLIKLNILINHILPNKLELVYKLEHGYDPQHYIRINYVHTRSSEDSGILFSRHRTVCQRKLRGPKQNKARYHKDSNAIPTQF